MNAHIEYEAFDDNHKVGVLPNTKLKIEQYIKNEITPEEEQCNNDHKHTDIKHEIQLSPKHFAAIRTLGEVVLTDEQQKNTVPNEANISVVNELNNTNKSDLVKEKCCMSVSDVPRENSYTCRICNKSLFKNNYANIYVKTTDKYLLCNMCKRSSFYTGTFFTMNSHLEYDIKHEADQQNTDLKTEPENIKNEINPKSEECDDFPNYVEVKHETQVMHTDFQQKSTEENDIKIPLPDLSCKADSANEKCGIYVCDSEITRENNYLCTVCKKSLENLTNISVKSIDKELMCTMCKSDNPHVSKQNLNHNICSESFSEESNLVTHNSIVHAVDKRYTCNFCGKLFSDKFKLIEHNRSHTGEKPFSCELCGKLFSRKSNLNRHNNAHTGEKPFTCTLCSSTFSRKHDIDRHVRTHTGERPFTCDICNLSFIEKCGLSMHMRVHSDEKLFSCNFCTKSFSRKFNLVTHTRIHTGEKPFECDICKKSFSVKNDLHRHMYHHTGERMYICDFCTKSFPTKQGVSGHIQIHIDEKQFPCEFCNKSFSRKFNLERHKTVHKL